MTRRWLWGVPLLGALSACSALGPDFHKPTPTPEDLPLTAKAWTPVELRLFKDPVLAQLIERAQKDNPSIDQAKAGLLQARLTARGVLVSQGLSAGGQSSLTRAQTLQTTTTAMAAADASWQLDIFGGQRRQNQELQALSLSSEDQLRAARISLAAEVASTYTDLRGCEQQAHWLHQTEQAQAQLLALTQRQLEAGVVPLDSVLAASNAEQAARQQGLTQSQACENDRIVLQSLTGLPEKELFALLKPDTGHLPQIAAMKVPEAVAAEVVTARPDVAAAGHQLQAKSADIGFQTSKLLPSLTLMGSIGMNRLQGAASTTSWSFGPSLSIPTLDPRVVSLARQEAEAAYQGAYAAWRGAVRNAVAETSKALTQLQVAEQQEQSATLVASKARELARLTDRRFTAGTVTALDTVNARLSDLASKRALVSARMVTLQSWIALYKATASDISTLEPNSP